MKITRSTLMTAFAKMLEDRLDCGMLLSHGDLTDDWNATGLRMADLEGLLEELYALHYIDRTMVGTEPWYRLTPTGTIELRISREAFWARWRDRLNLMRIRARRSTPPQRMTTSSARRRSDRIASESP